MEYIKAVANPMLKYFRKWTQCCWLCCCLENADTLRSQRSSSIQISSPEVVAMESFESSSCSSEESVSSEPRSPHNQSSMSFRQAIPSRTQIRNAELAVNSKMPCRAAHPLLFQDNLAHLRLNHNRGRPEHVRHRQINRPTHGGKKQVNPRNRCMMQHLPHRTNMEEINASELHSTAENLDNFGRASTLCSSLPSHEEDEGGDSNMSQLDMSRHLVASLRSSFSQSHLTRVEMEEDTLQRRTSATDTLQSSTEAQRPSAPDNTDSLVRLYGSCQGAAKYTPSRFPKDSRRDKERSSDTLPVEEIKCRYCHCSETSPDNPLLSPCKCSGSMQFVHFDCLKQWLRVKIQSGSFLHNAQTCEVCKSNLLLDPDTFDWIDFYQEQLRNQNDIESGGDPEAREMVTRLQELEVAILSTSRRRITRVYPQRMAFGNRRPWPQPRPRPTDG
ncbi:E3 ubiquitin-protein ligase MARCHF7-like [Melanotaenia boesemani]|uniref:E3 ubiquitin-protein ligase MARCHF7-like n=1 Tax=Melanotaenia boesemani TaxID=1250792 RepID=UPI001C05200B|nr:E3 ubiquitin-protein ligase MARCHF7-like [Melanotaenia boesemani]